MKSMTEIEIENNTFVSYYNILNNMAIDNMLFLSIELQRYLFLDL